MSFNYTVAKERRTIFVSNKILKWSVSIGLGFLCMWLSFRGVDWNIFFEQLRQLSFWPIFLAIPGFVITHILRTKRWRLMLKTICQVKFFDLFSIGSVGFLAIQILPFRLGEFTRPLLLKKQYGVAVSTGMATIIIERVLDGIAAALILFIGISNIDHHHLMIPGAKWGLDALVVWSFALFVPMLAVLMGAVFQKEKTRFVLKSIFKFFPEKFRDRLSTMLESFFIGLASLPDLKSFLILFVDSLLVWGVLLFSYWTLAIAFHMSLPWNAPFCIVGLSAMSMMLPGPPGAVGVYQLAVQIALGIFGVSRELGLAYAMVFYFINLVYILISGLMGGAYLSTSFKDLTQET